MELENEQPIVGDIESIEFPEDPKFGELSERYEENKEESEVKKTETEKTEQAKTFDEMKKKYDNLMFWALGKRPEKIPENLPEQVRSNLLKKQAESIFPKLDDVIDRCFKYLSPEDMAIVESVISRVSSGGQVTTADLENKVVQSYIKSVYEGLLREGFSEESIKSASA